MKKILIIAAIMAFSFSTAKAEELKHNEKITKTLKLEFDEQAKNDSASISWELLGNWDKFDYEFSQGMDNNDVFTIYTADYKPYDGIVLTIKGKSKTSSGDYNLIMKIKGAENLDIKDEDLNYLNLDLNIHYEAAPFWTKLIVPGIILLALILILIIVLNVTAKFPSGLLQLGRDEVNIKGKKMVSVKNELEKMGVQLESDTDVIFVKKRFGSFQGPCVKEMKNCALEREGVYLSKGAVILPDEEIHGLKDLDGNEIIIRYC